MWEGGGGMMERTQRQPGVGPRRLMGIERRNGIVWRSSSCTGCCRRSRSVVAARCVVDEKVKWADGLEVAERFMLK